MGHTESVFSGAAGRGGYPVVEVDLALVDEPEEALRLDLDPDRLEELARSMQRIGLLHPPGYRRVGERWRVVWGHRRTEAARLLGWRRITACEVVGDATEGVVMAAAENLERADMSPVEEAGAVSRLYDACGQDVDAVARRINRSRAWVEGRLRVLSWPDDVQRLVHEGRLSMAAAVELASITDDGHRAFLLGHAVDGGATARTCQAWRIAWLQTGVVPDVSVQQVRPGGVAPAPVEAELPCYLCGRRRSWGELTHVWLDADCLQVFVQARESLGALEAGPGAAGPGGMYEKRGRRGAGGVDRARVRNRYPRAASAQMRSVVNGASRKGALSRCPDQITVPMGLVGSLGVSGQRRETRVMTIA